MEREKSRLSGEFQAARSVQQLLIANSQSPCLDAFYQPAQEVGGDFYQIFPLPDGSELLAVGDVSGKGLKAAMAVSMLTGALRNRHAETPAALLSELNRAVAGGLDGGFVTAAIARLYPNGRLTLASAGHPSPYLNGQELTLEPGLPLGIYREAEYADTETNLPPNQPLTFVSDGVIEAANAKNELFGFDRTQALSLRPAAEIAQAAQSWGQNDDITVAILQRAS
jgi:serine phosphatase RsbU (regulator of sigma subunit)